MNKYIYDFEARARIKAEQPKLIVVCAFCYGKLRYRGVSTTAIADGEHVKDLTLDDETIELLELDGNKLPAGEQTDGDVFIYDNGTECLEVVVYDGKYGVVRISEMWADLMEDRSPEEKELAEESCSEVRGLLDGQNLDNLKNLLECLMKKIEDHMNVTQVAVESSNKKFGEIDSKINEIQTAASLMVRIGRQKNAEVEGLRQSIAGLPAAIAEAKAAATGAKVAAEGARVAAEKAAKKPTTVINAQPGASVTVVKPPRTDAGETHGKTAQGWRKQREVAADFSISAKKIRGKLYGEVTVATVKDWEKRYPNETHKHPKCGYHAQMRRDSKYKTDAPGGYWEAAANWNNYWEKHNAAFLAWLNQNPKGDHATFLMTWERPGKTVHRNDTDKTMRYGADTSLPDALDSGDFDNET